MKKIFLIISLVSFLGYGQWAKPSGYTTNYGYRLYSQGAKPGNDSLNQNWIDIDTTIKVVYDSAQAKVNRWTNQTVAGIKTFSDSLILSGNVNHKGISIDTIASRSWARDSLPTISGYVDLFNSQTVAGVKTLTGKLKFSGAGILQIPTEIYAENQYALCGNSNMMFYYYGKYDYDSLLSYRLLRNYLNGYMTNSITPYTNDVYSLGTSTKRFRSIYGNYIVADTFVVSKIFSPIADTMEIVSGVLKINGHRLASYSTEGGLQIGEREKTLGAVYTDSLISDASLQISALGTGGNGVIALNAEMIGVNGQFHKEVQNVTITTTTFPTVTKSLVHMESDVNVTISTIPRPSFNKEGFILTIVMTGGAGFVTLSDNVDNLRLAGDFDMGLTDAISLMWHTGSECWIEISRSNNN